jgi:hypothetical protein
MRASEMREKNKSRKIKIKVEKKVMIYGLKLFANPSLVLPQCVFCWWATADVPTIC